MTLLQTQTPQSATGDVAKIYDAIAQSFGRVPNAMQFYSTSPALLARQWDSIRYYRAHKSLTPALLATIRMLVSKNNACDYCVGFNEALLINMCGQTTEQVAATKARPEAAPLGEKDRAMLLFVLKSMSAPHSVAAADIKALHVLGWADSDIMDAVAHGAQNTFVDIMFNTFKIEKDF